MIFAYLKKIIRIFYSLYLKDYNNHFNKVWVSLHRKYCITFLRAKEIIQTQGPCSGLNVIGWYIKSQVKTGTWNRRRKQA